MKLVALVGTNAEFSFNRFLCQFIAKKYAGDADIEVLEIADLPAFHKEGQADERVAAFRDKIAAADGVIVSTPEYDHAIPAALKSALEWLGSHAGANVMAMKPACVVGVSLGGQGASRSQEDAREILLSPDMMANVLPGNELLIGWAYTTFNKESGELVDEAALAQLDKVMNNFFDFVKQAHK